MMNISAEVIGVLGIAAALIVYIWGDQRERNKKTEQELETKASISMVNGLREEMRSELTEIGGKLDRVRDTSQMNALTLAKIEGQIGRLVSHADSESGTRARASDRLEHEIRALRQALTSSGRRKTDPPETMP